MVVGIIFFVQMFVFCRADNVAASAPRFIQALSRPRETFCFYCYSSLFPLDLARPRLLFCSLRCCLFPMSFFVCVSFVRKKEQNERNTKRNSFLPFCSGATAGGRGSVDICMSYVLLLLLLVVVLSLSLSVSVSLSVSSSKLS